MGLYVNWLQRNGGRASNSDYQQTTCPPQASPRSSSGTTGTAKRRTTGTCAANRATSTSRHGVGPTPAGMRVCTLEYPAELPAILSSRVLGRPTGSVSTNSALWTGVRENPVDTQGYMRVRKACKCGVAPGHTSGFLCKLSVSCLEQEDATGRGSRQNDNAGYLIRLEHTIPGLRRADTLNLPNLPST